MQDTPRPNAPVPPDCFQQAELETFQSFENQKLGSVSYYLWRASAKSSFLYALELVFAHGEMLLLSSGEDSTAIRIITPEKLLETARQLQLLHGEALIQRIKADIQPLWRDVVGATLEEVRLARHESGLFHNDVMLFIFDESQILLELSEKDGLVLAPYDIE